MKRAFTVEEIAQLTAKHEARKNPALTVERSEVQRLDMPPFAKVTNRVDVIFSGAEPKILKEQDC